MKWATHRRVRALIVSLIILGTIVALLVWLNRISRPGSQTILSWAKPKPSLSPATEASPTPPREDAATVPGAASTPIPLDPGIAPDDLIVPVAGVRADQLRDTFSDARSDGRVHDAIDIPAPRGTPVLAAADGQILRLSQSERGGSTIYHMSVDNRFVYYYAHLDGYAAGLSPGHAAKRGEIIGYVGDTGNAGAGNYHLHFSIAVISDPKRYWEGVNINPFPLLRK